MTVDCKSLLYMYFFSHFRNCIGDFEYIFHIESIEYTLVSKMYDKIHCLPQLGLFSLMLQIHMTSSMPDGAPLTQCRSMQPGHGYNMYSSGTFTLQMTSASTYTPGGNAVQGRHGEG